MFFSAPLRAWNSKAMFRGRQCHAELISSGSLKFRQPSCQSDVQSWALAWGTEKVSPLQEPVVMGVPKLTAAET